MRAFVDWLYANSLNILFYLFVVCVLGVIAAAMFFYLILIMMFLA